MCNPMAFALIAAAGSSAMKMQADSARSNAELGANRLMAGVNQQFRDQRDASLRTTIGGSGPNAQIQQERQQANGLGGAMQHAVNQGTDLFSQTTNAPTGPSGVVQPGSTADMTAFARAKAGKSARSAAFLGAPALAGNARRRTAGNEASNRETIDTGRELTLQAMPWAMADAAREGQGLYTLSQLGSSVSGGLASYSGPGKTGTSASRARDSGAVNYQSLQRTRPLSDQGLSAWDDYLSNNGTDGSGAA